VRRDGRGLAELAGRLRLYPQKLINVRVAREFDWQGDAAIGQARVEAEGRLGERGRLLLRASGTEPVLRVMVEGEDEAEVAAVAAELAARVERAAAA
jgi:phosphoglucosamine mutase